MSLDMSARIVIKERQSNHLFIKYYATVIM